MTVFLFDIDGTLLTTHGSGHDAVEAAMERLFGRPFDTSGITYSGKTDRQILREVIETQDDLEVNDLDAAVEEAARLYSEEMPRHLDVGKVTALPGAQPLVHRMASEDAPMGLLTGNLEPMAYRKLSRVNLDGHFPFGAFGSDHEDRNALPGVALGRARRRFGDHLEPRHLLLIGDTPRDVACARALGARVVAVATGNYDADALSDADEVLRSLETFDPAAYA